MKDSETSSCHVIVIAADDDDTVKLLLITVKIDFGDTPKHQTLLVDQEGKVKCTPKARPSPVVDWYKNQVALKNGKSL